MVSYALCWVIVVMWLVALGWAEEIRPNASLTIEAVYPYSALHHQSAPCEDLSDPLWFYLAGGPNATTTSLYVGQK